MTEGTEDVEHTPLPDRPWVPWWVLLGLSAMILGTLIVLALCTTAPLILVAEAIAVVLLSVDGLTKILKDLH
jgi:hypothetical protein